MLKDGELAADGNDQPYVFEESPSCKLHVLAARARFTRAEQTSRVPCGHISCRA